MLLDSFVIKVVSEHFISVTKYETRFNLNTIVRLAKEYGSYVHTHTGAYNHSVVKGQ